MNENNLPHIDEEEPRVDHRVLDDAFHRAIAASGVKLTTKIDNPGLGREVEAVNFDEDPDTGEHRFWFNF